MDWREFMRGFFGNAARGENGDQWPPPPPISEFTREDDHDNEGAFFRGTPNRPHCGDDFQNRFVFGNLFSAMGEMFQEMERSMKDMEGFFGRLDDRFTSPLFPFSDSMSPPPAIQGSPQPHSKDDNIRDFVLKESDTPHEDRANTKHYIPVPDNASEKIDRDLDDLHKNSMLDLSDLPLPSAIQGNDQHKSMSPFNFGQHGRLNSSFQKTYQTFSFRNGRWEGEIVKEDQNGKEVTRYYQDKDGKRHETTQYFSRNESSSTSSQSPAVKDFSQDFTPSNEHIRPFQFFERFFKPRM